MSFGYIGTGKTQTEVDNSGVFSLKDIDTLKNEHKYADRRAHV